MCPRLAAAWAAFLLAGILALAHLTTDALGAETGAYRIDVYGLETSATVPIVTFRARCFAPITRGGRPARMPHSVWRSRKAKAGRT